MNDEHAFPSATTEEKKGSIYLKHHRGMSLRDYFAGKALASGQCPHNSYDHKKRAEWCKKEADAMMEVRGK